MGPANDLEELAHSDWKITLIAESKVNDCANNMLIQSDLTVAGGERTDAMQQYQVLPSGDDPVVKSIPIKKVVPTVTGCPVETVVYIDTIYGYEKELKDNEYISLNLDLASMTIDITITQD